MCKLCIKQIYTSTMGKTALTSHMKSEKHKQFEAQQHSKPQSSMKSFIQSNKESPNTSQTVSSSAKTTVSSFVSKTRTLTAEVWWCSKAIDSNYSFASSVDNAYIFKKLFPDSGIASQFTCSETKSMYLSCFGIAPYIVKTLEANLKDQPFVIMFDESLNQDMQKKQLGLILRFWDTNTVNSRYYTSDFLGRACATDPLESFEKNIECKISLQNLVQLSMDGPNVNWSTYNKLQHKLETQHHFQLINIGSCGLHTLHNAFRAGLVTSGWEIGHKLSALHTLFSDVPARREDYESVTKSSCYPLSFCGHRWLENVKVCESALEIHSHMKCYVESVSKKTVKDPQTKSFETIKKWIQDPLAKAKLMFTISIGKSVENFIRQISP